MRNELRKIIRVSTHLGFRDLRVRYAQTLLGPWLSAVALSALLVGTSLAAGVLGGTSLRDNLPVISISLAFWVFASNSLIESAEVYEVERGLLLNSRITTITLVYRLIWRNFLVGLHNWPIVIAATALAGGESMLRALMFPLGLVVIAIMIIGPLFVVARMCLYHRDIARVIPAVIQVIFFVTPILWLPPAQGMGRMITVINPFAWSIEIGQKFILQGEIPILPLVKTAAWCAVSILVLNVASRGSHRDRLWI